MELLKTFLYFAIFKHPLTKSEALAFCQYPTDNIDAELEELIEKKLLFKIDEYYLLANEKSWVERRRKGNQLAAKKMKKAKKLASFIGKFPLVRSVMISGSLSKGYMDEDSDIDFFVIMAPGNMSIPKAILGLFRRLFAQKSMCVNYVVSEENLLIKKRDVYTATEMATLIPMKDSTGLFEHFMAENLFWIQEFLPNFIVDKSKISPIEKNSVKSFFEWLVSSRPANFLDQKLIAIYAKRANRVIRENESKYIKKEGHEEYIIDKGVLKMHDVPHHSLIMQKYLEYSRIVDSGGEIVFKKYSYD